MHTKDRQSFYDNAGKIISKEFNVTAPNNHTMGEENFRRYIGTYHCDNYDLDNKKFGKEQSELIKDAYINNNNILVISAYREDLAFLLDKNKAEKISSVVSHTKGGLFNCRRQIMCQVKRSGKKELWVLVFPSTYYVDQIAQLIKAIVIEFSDKVEDASSSTKVSVVHFPTIEKNISKWTGFEDFISLFVRYGDVVIIGNVDLVLIGLDDYSFLPQNDNFHEGGLDEMFGAKLLVHNHSFHRIVLIGVKESYWGDASAQYVKSIIEAGAMHILYGSKAATMVECKDVHKIYIPKLFKLFNDNLHLEIINYQIKDIKNYTKILALRKLYLL